MSVKFKQPEGLMRQTWEMGLETGTYVSKGTYTTMLVYAHSFVREPSSRLRT